MLRILGLVLCIGLADSVSPSTSLTGLFLASGRDPRRSVLEFAAGVFAVFLVAGLILTLGPGAAILSLVPRPSATTRYVLETIAGLAMLIVAAKLWRRRGSGEGRAVKRVEDSRRGPAAMGVAIAAVELPTAFPYFAAIAAIVGSGVDMVSQVILVAVYCVCFVLPLLGIALAITIAGEPAVQRLMRARRWLVGHWPMLLSRLALVAGIFVVTLGVTGLTLTTPGDTGQFSRGLRHLLTHPLQQ
ncbi:MAG TPA: GAP family protein [Solirubrobacteraceae bacterium]|nr:GAP family protein [Solirubrobacteraceae bacterium]